MKDRMSVEQLGEILAMLLKTFIKVSIEAIKGNIVWGVTCTTAQQIVKDNPDDFFRRFLQFLTNGGRVVFDNLKLACTKTFNPAKFIGEGWTVWKGPADGDGMEGEEERDKRADELSAIDWEEVLMETYLQDNETSITGKEKLKRAKAGGNIQLGDKAFLFLWEDYKANGKNSVLEKLRLKGITRIYFFGTVLRYPGGRRCVLSLYLRGSECHWSCRWLGLQWRADGPSASLASVK